MKFTATLLSKIIGTTCAALPLPIGVAVLASQSTTHSVPDNWLSWNESSLQGFDSNKITQPKEMFRKYNTLNINCTTHLNLIAGGGISNNAFNSHSPMYYYAFDKDNGSIETVNFTNDNPQATFILSYQAIEMENAPFADCHTLTSISFSGYGFEIENYAFVNSGTQDIYLNQTTTPVKLGDGSLSLQDCKNIFMNCPLQTIHIPLSMKTMYASTMWLQLGVNVKYF